MGKKHGMHPLVLMGGIAVIVLLFVIFVPVILGATANSRDIERYNGTSQTGNETVSAANAIDSYFVGLIGIGMLPVALLVGVFCAVAGVIYVIRGLKK